MKKLLALLLAAFLLAGCGSPEPAPEKGTETAAASAPSVVTQAPTEPDFWEGKIGEITWEGELLDEQETPILHLSCSIPEIRDDSPDARALNEAFQGFLDLGKVHSPYCYQTISWESHCVGSVATLVLELWPAFEGQPEYAFCHYDFAEGRELNNSEFLDRLGILWQDASEAAAFAAADAFDRDSLSIYERQKDCFGGVQELRAQTLSSQSLNPDCVPMYLDESGILHMLARMGTPAGAGYYTRDLSLNADLLWPDSPDQTVVLDNVEARLYRNRVTLKITPTEGIGLRCPEIYPDLQYPVQGLYGEYTGIALGYLGNGGEMYLAALDTTGRVSLCNLWYGAAEGFGFCAMGPLPYPLEVVDLVSVPDPYGWDFAAVTKSGEQISLFEPYDQAITARTYSLEDRIWQGEDGSHTMSIRWNQYGGYYELTWSAGGGVLGSGVLRYEGLTQEGMRFRCSLYGEDGSASNMLLWLSQDSWGLHGINVFSVSGTPLFPEAWEGEMYFTQQYS